MVVFDYQDNQPVFGSVWSRIWTQSKQAEYRQGILRQVSNLAPRMKLQELLETAKRVSKVIINTICTNYCINHSSDVYQ